MAEPAGASSETKGRHKDGTPKVTDRHNDIEYTAISTDDKDSGHNDGQSAQTKIPGVFTEMQELFYLEAEDEQADETEVEWRETTRWVKFEETVESSGLRWSKPHVAALSLKALSDLRTCLNNNDFLLDANKAEKLEDVVDAAYKLLMTHIDVSGEQAEAIRDLLLEPHVHEHQLMKQRSLKRGSTSHVDLSSLAPVTELKEGETPQDAAIVSSVSHPNLLAHIKRRGSSANLLNTAHTNENTPEPDTSSPAAKQKHNIRRRSSFTITLGPTESEKEIITENKAFSRKVEKDACGASVLVGGVPCLTERVALLVRFHESSVIPELTEIKVPLKFIFVLLGPCDKHGECHALKELGRSMGTLFSDPKFQRKIQHAKTKDVIMEGIDEFMADATVLPASEWDHSTRLEPPTVIPNKITWNSNLKDVEKEQEEEHGDPALKRTGRLFGGLISDIKRKAPFYASDFKDAFHIQSVSTFFFIYFASLSTVITFGGMMGDELKENMSAMETMLSAGICGVTFALLAGQPLIILGSTGPILVFETILFNFARDMDPPLPYLNFRVWVGLWTSLFLLLIVMFDLNFLVKYITRFTEEGFSCLISLIFIVESFKKVAKIHVKNPINRHPDDDIDYNCTCYPNVVNLTGDCHVMQPSGAYYIASWRNYSKLNYKTCEDNGGQLCGSGCDSPHYMSDVFLLSFVIFIGVFIVAMSLKMFRYTSFFPNIVRKTVSDFAIPIAIAVFTGLDIGVGLATPKLKIPETFAPTSSDRGWFIAPLVDPWWSIIAALPLALLLTILVVMDQQISAVIVNNKKNLLVKGKGYHLDLLLISIQVCACSVLGIPYFVAATVDSINHVLSLGKDSDTTAPGEKPKFLGVREQRVTGCMAFLFIGMSVLFTPVLKHVPMPVLYGVFLYMGVASLRGVQFFERLQLLFMPRKYQPDFLFLRHVDTNRVHLFTLIQAFFLALLWVFKSVKQISILFPLMVLGLCIARKLMGFVFSDEELKYLDDPLPPISCSCCSKKKKDEDELIKLENGKLKNLGKC